MLVGIITASSVLSRLVLVGNMLVVLVTPSSVLVHLMPVEDMLLGVMTPSFVLVTVHIFARFLILTIVTAVTGVVVVTGVMIGVSLTVLMSTDPVLVMWLVMTFETGSEIDTEKAAQSLLVSLLVVENIAVTGMMVVTGVVAVTGVMIVARLTVFLATGPALVIWVVTTFATGP